MATLRTQIKEARAELGAVASKAKVTAFFKARGLNAQERIQSAGVMNLAHVELHPVMGEQVRFVVGG